MLQTWRDQAAERYWYIGATKDVIRVEAPQNYGSEGGDKYEDDEEAWEDVDVEEDKEDDIEKDSQDYEGAEADSDNGWITESSSQSYYQEEVNFERPCLAADWLEYEDFDGVDKYTISII
jgi:hypothetical protein